MDRAEQAEASDRAEKAAQECYTNKEACRMSKHLLALLNQLWPGEVFARRLEEMLRMVDV